MINERCSTNADQRVRKIPLLIDESVSSTVVNCQLVFLRCQHVVQKYITI